MALQNNEIVTDAKSFSGALTVDLTDEDIKKAFELITRIKNKHTALWRMKYPFDSMDQINEFIADFEHEIKTELAEKLNVLATVDTVPLLQGEPLEVEWIGKLPGDNLYKYGFDHEKKEFEVKRAVNRKENFYGEKGPEDGAAKRRDSKNKKM